MERYEILEDKYKRVVAKYEFYTNQELKKRKLELDYKDKNLCKEEEDMADLKLQDNLLKNLFLRNIASEIKKQIQEIEVAHKKYVEEEELIKFLGKALYNKVKKRRMEAEQNNQNDNNKSINNNTSFDNDIINNNSIYSKTVSNMNFKNKNTSKISNNLSIQIKTGNLRDSLLNTSKTTKNKMNITTTVSE